MKPADLHFFIDPNGCIGCQACVQACVDAGDTLPALNAIETELRHAGVKIAAGPALGAAARAL